MAGSRKRIGFVLGSIHGGVASEFFSGFIKKALAEEVNFFVFPGGLLNCRTDSEYLRNPIYSLVNPDNLDGFIIRSSTIRYTESWEEFEHFHRSFEPLPYVSLAYNMKDHPSVEFDSYKGMKDLVSHFINVHGARKIAFLRGPEFHYTTLKRYQGYLDALKENGIPCPEDSPLVSGYFSWSCGAAAAVQLFEGRSLVPGRDFDTLIGSSDLMVFGAVDYFAKQGYHILKDYRVGGFNDSMGSRLLESPLSTVHMPKEAMCQESFRLLLSQLGSPSASEPEHVFLESKVIIRESCGCKTPRIHRSWNTEFTTTFPPEESITAISTAIAGEMKLSPADMTARVLPALRAFFYEGEERFLALFEEGLAEFLGDGRDPETLFKLIHDFITAAYIPAEKTAMLDSFMYSAIYRIRERQAIHDQTIKDQWNATLNTLKYELWGARNRSALIQSLARYLPKIGITTASIMLYEDEKISVCMGSFSAEGINPLQKQRFPSRQLFPAYLARQYANGIFLVQPLFMENQSLGYFLHNVPSFDGIIFEELRSTISYALKGVMLFEEISRAKKIAEQGDQAKTDFIATLEDKLYTHLSLIREKIEDLEKSLPGGSGTEGSTKLPGGSGTEGSAKLQSMKDFVSAQEAEMGNLIDLILFRIEDISLQKRLFDPGDMLPGLESLPLLAGDLSRLNQCFNLLREVFGGKISARLLYRGLAISFQTSEMSNSTNDRKYRLLLAEQLILLHGGELQWEASGCTVVLPWITYTGQEPSRHPVGLQDHILVLSDPALLPADFLTLPLVYEVEKAAALPGRTALIVWNNDDDSIEGFLRLSALKHHPEFFSVPVICYYKKLAGITLAEAVEQAIKTPKKSFVLFIGMPPASYRDWEETAETVRIPSMAFFEGTVAEISPSLLVFKDLDLEAVAEVRQHPITAVVPILVIPDLITRMADVITLSQYSRILLCNSSVASSPEFFERIRGLLGGTEILPCHTGALIKKTILAFNENPASAFTRWKLSAAINVSEDYLTKIFHKEMGIALWDYLNRYRVFLAADLLVQTDDTIQKIAFRVGFQDSAYFCRVFKKICGTSPGSYRKHKTVISE
jgi:DNA-binding LacI/PurR family transcriptional regulator/AraC-like DNA-binding protein